MLPNDLVLSSTTSPFSHLTNMIYVVCCTSVPETLSNKYTIKTLRKKQILQNVLGLGHHRVQCY